MALADSSAASPSPRRTLWTVLLILSLLWLGFVAGMVIAGRFFVPAGSGLAGPAIALGYGVSGAVAGAVLAGLFAWKLPARPLRLLTMAAILLSALTIAFIAFRVARDVAGQLT